MKYKTILSATLYALPAMLIAAEPDFADDFTNTTGSNVGSINYNIDTRQKGPLAPIRWEQQAAFISADGRFLFPAVRGTDAWATLAYDLSDTDGFDISFLLQPDVTPEKPGKLDLGINFGIPEATSPGSPFTGGAPKNALMFQRLGGQLRVNVVRDGDLTVDEFLTAPANDAFKVHVRGEKEDGVWVLKFAVPDAGGFVREQVMPSGWTPAHLALFARKGNTPASMAAFDDFTLKLK